MAIKDPQVLTIEREIIKLKSDVDIALLEASDEDLSPQLRELRDRVFLAHSSVESSMDFDIFSNTLISATPKVQDKRYVKRTEFEAFITALDPLQRGMTFTRKLQVLKDTNVYSDSLFQLLSKLNHIRVEFAHPKEKKYKKYESRNEYKIALETIKKSLLDINSEELKMERFILEKKETTP